MNDTERKAYQATFETLGTRYNSRYVLRVWNAESGGIQDMEFEDAEALTCVTRTLDFLDVFYVIWERRENDYKKLNPWEWDIEE